MRVFLRPFILLLIYYRAKSLTSGSKGRTRVRIDEGVFFPKGLKERSIGRPCGSQDRWLSPVD